MLRDIQKVVSNLFPMLKCLHRLSSKLPGAPFGKRVCKVLTIFSINSAVRSFYAMAVGVSL